MKLEFDPLWVSKIMSYVRSICFKVLKDSDTFNSEGLRQGYPLSPYIFLFCAESLSYLILKYEIDKKIFGVTLCRNMPIVTHLFFADNSLIFLKADEYNSSYFIDILSAYVKASGQKINFEKPALFFSPNCADQVKDNIMLCYILLRSPSMKSIWVFPPWSGGAKTHLSNLLKTVWKRIQGWREKLLSKSSKEILMKVVAQSITTYSMSCFLLPNSLCYELS